MGFRSMSSRSVIPARLRRRVIAVLRWPAHTRWRWRRRSWRANCRSASCHSAAGGSMFRRLDPTAGDIRFSYEGREVAARPGDSVAAALLAAGETALRATPVSQAPRAPYCMMGVCFECVMEIDGVGNGQACLTAVAVGVLVRRQRGARELL